MSSGTEHIQVKIRSLVYKMHAFPCSGLLTCFGHERENVPFDPAGNNALEVQKSDVGAVVIKQPCTNVPGGKNSKTGCVPENNLSQCCHPERNGITNCTSKRTSYEDSKVLGSELDTDLVSIHTHIPRPTIITVPMVSANV